MSDSPLISAVICTFNRAAYLRKAIQSLVEQSLGSSQYEIIVVDNNSTDDTQTVVTREFADAANLTYIFEARVGLSQARNTGLEQARGKYIAYLDDDAIAAFNWLEATLTCFETATFPIGCVGGKINPIWEAPRPAWLPNDYLSYLTVLDWGDEPIAIDRSKYVAGASIAFQTELLRKLGGFSTALGRKGKSLLSSEEVWLQELIRRSGYIVYYDPKITVGHHVSASRLTREWFFRRLYWQGISSAFLDLAQNPGRLENRLKIVLKYTKNLLTHPEHYLYFLIPSKTSHSFHRRCGKLKTIGYFWGLISLPEQAIKAQSQTLQDLQPVIRSQVRSSKACSPQ